ncbi:MAG: hypothetical protein HQ523_10485 [Lentisphaerae bacterium]|nr:hypothetical protein [Lentisphaerota bacterium]
MKNSENGMVDLSPTGQRDTLPTGARRTFAWAKIGIIGGLVALAIVIAIGLWL